MLQPWQQSQHLLQQKESLSRGQQSAVGHFHYIASAQRGGLLGLQIQGVMVLLVVITPWTNISQPTNHPKCWEKWKTNIWNHQWLILIFLFLLVVNDGKYYGWWRLIQWLMVDIMVDTRVDDAWCSGQTWKILWLMMVDIYWAVMVDMNSCQRWSIQWSKMVNTMVMV